MTSLNEAPAMTAETILTTPSPSLDLLDARFVHAAMARRKLRLVPDGLEFGPEDGDWVRFPDGQLERIAHVWSPGRVNGQAEFQPWAGGGRFYLTPNGYMDFSGELKPMVRCRLRLANEVRPGWAWTFHHQRPQHSGVEFKVNLPVWEIVDV